MGAGSPSGGASTRAVRCCCCAPGAGNPGRWCGVGSRGGHGTAGCPQRGRGNGGSGAAGGVRLPAAGTWERGARGPRQPLTPPAGAPRAPSPAASRTAGRGYAAAWQQPFYSLPARLGPRASSPPPPARLGAPIVRLPSPPLPLPGAPPAPRAAPAPLHLITRLSRLLSCS